MATLRNVDDIVPWALGCPGVRRQAASHQEGEALLLRKHSFLEQECHQSLSEGLCLLYLPSCLKKNLCYEKFQTHTKVRRTCNEARTSVPNIQRLSGCRHRRLICPSFSFPFPLLEYFKANPRHHVISPSCTSVGIKKNFYASCYFQNTVLTRAPQTGLLQWRLVWPQHARPGPSRLPAFLTVRNSCDLWLTGTGAED